MPVAKTAHPYRSVAATVRPRPGVAVPSSITEAIFEVPAASVQWTGDGVRADSWGRMQSVRHAMDWSAAGMAPEEVALAEVPKLLAIQSLRSPSHADLRAWLGGWAGEGVRRETVARVLADVRRNLLVGEEIVVGFEPRLGRTRIVWPWDAHTDVHDIPFMRAAWRSYFDAGEQPELKRQLLRWVV